MTQLKKSLWLVLLLLAIVCLIVESNSDTQSGDVCNIHLYLPYSIPAKNNVDGLQLSINPLAISHLKSAYLAAQHFNTRNNNNNNNHLSDDDNYSNCTIQLNITASHDTNIIGPTSSLSFQQMVRDYGKNNICAIAGPYDDKANEQISILGATMQIPIVLHRSHNPRLSLELFHPFPTQTYPSLFNQYLILASFTATVLQRTNYIAILYALADTSINRQNILQRNAFGERVNVGGNAPTHIKSFGYLPWYGNGANGTAENIQDNDIATAMKKIKATGFRTIIILSELLDLQISLPLIANEAEKLDMLNGDYVYIFDAALELQYFDFLQSSDDNNNNINSNLTKLLTGASIVTPIAQYDHDLSDPFWQSWNQLNTNMSTLEYIQQLQPEHLINFTKEYNYSPLPPAQDSGFLYDSVLSIGYGACVVQKQQQQKQQQFDNNNNNNTNMNGPAALISQYQSRVEAIRSTDFNGVTGRVTFGNSNGFELARAALSAGTRSESTCTFGVYNYQPHTIVDDTTTTPLLHKPVLTHVWSSNNNSKWVPIQQFYFANNSTNPPVLLRDVPEQNYLSPFVRGTGLTMFTISTLLILFFLAWTIYQRNHRIVRAAQPPLLVCILLGCFITNISLLIISFDESTLDNNNNDDAAILLKLNGLCATLPWTIVIGHLVTHGAIFTKLWRVNKVLQFNPRTKIEIHHVIWPLRIMIFLATLLLTLWTIFDPTEWIRQEINFETGESFGACQGGAQSHIWYIPILILMLTPTILAFLMAWKTKNVDSTFSEAWWIFALIFIQFQTLLVSAPLIAILNDLSTNGRYIGFALIFWTIPMSTTTMIFFPKLYHVSFNQSTSNSNRQTTRGAATGTVRVSGLVDTQQQEQQQQQDEWRNSLQHVVATG